MYFKRMINFTMSFATNLYRYRSYRQPSKNLKMNNKTNHNNSEDYKLRSGLRTFTIVVTTSWCITHFFTEPILLQGPSMEPTIQHNDVIIAEKYTVTFRKHDYKRGDIVVVRSPMNPHQFICKRIVALPGDNIGKRYHFSSYRQTVPKGHVWLLGDNKSNSTDSREFGALPMGLIIGRVVYRIWPLNRIMNFRNEDNKNKYN